VRAGDAAEEKWTAGSWFHERLWSEPGSWDTGGMYTVKIYARVRRAVLVEGHVSAFAYFGGVPRQILYDNTKLAVAKILGAESGRRRGRSVNYRATAYLKRSSDVRARATTRGRWKGWWAMRGGTFWCRFHAWAVGRS